MQEDLFMNTHTEVSQRTPIHALSLMLACFLFSCGGFQDEIVSQNVDVETIDRVLVINGKIEQDSRAIVQISYSEDIDAPATTPIHYEENASVLLTSDDGSSEALTYSGDGWYRGVSITGEVGRTYTMTIGVGNQTYTATSTMFPPPGYRDAWVVAVDSKGSGGKDGGKDGGGVAYSDEWRVLDPPETRNRYLFEWWRNGEHIVLRDWAIDDNRVVNAGGALRLFTVTMDPGPNEHTRHRAAEIDKKTYDYYNMYEKIVRGIVGVGSQTPYNPASNFGEGTIGNFRAVAFSSAVVLTPPGISAAGQNEQVVLSFLLNEFFTKYNLYWSTTPGVTKVSDVISDKQYGGSDKSSALYVHRNLTNGTTYYYRIEVEDANGHISILSPEVSATPDPTVPAGITSIPPGNAPTNVTAVAGKGEITISWDAVAGADGHLIYWDTNSGVTGKDRLIYGGGKGKEGISSPYTHTGLSSGVTYYYRVGAYFGKTVYLSEEVSATPN